MTGRQECKKQHKKLKTEMESGWPNEIHEEFRLQGNKQQLQKRHLRQQTADNMDKYSVICETFHKKDRQLACQTGQLKKLQKDLTMANTSVVYLKREVGFLKEKIMDKNGVIKKYEEDHAYLSMEFEMTKKMNKLLKEQIDTIQRKHQVLKERYKLNLYENGQKAYAIKELELRLKGAERPGNQRSSNQTSSIPIRLSSKCPGDLPILAEASQIETGLNHESRRKEDLSTKSLTTKAMRKTSLPFF
eukprot:gene13062-3839_t